MADLYDLSEEERREIEDYLDSGPDDRVKNMLGRKRTEFTNRGTYDVLGAIMDMSSSPMDYLEVDVNRAFAKVILRIENGQRGPK